jgi:Ca2+ transporting ATPase
VAAVASTVIGVLQEGWEKGWTEGVTIFFAIFLITAITTGNNAVKERQF